MSSSLKCRMFLGGVFFLFLILLPPFCTVVYAQVLPASYYNIGTPITRAIWIDPVSGHDSNSGDIRTQALRTVNAAWQRIPRGRELTDFGYELLLTPGNFPVESLPNYWEYRYGTYQYPIIFRAADGPGTVVFQSGPNIFDTRYLYFINVDMIPNPAGDAFHCELCDHVLIRGSRISGGQSRQAHETIKVNQSRYFFLENNDIEGAGDNAVDFVAVQYGHVLFNRIHNAGDWCIYVKGGSAYLTVSGNRIYDCGTGGFTAGQGTGFEFMTSPWLHYEAYDIKFVNNIVHDTEGAGFGINGGYNILAAFNTLYRIGSRSHAIEVVYGARSCDGNSIACSLRNSLGGWGPAIASSDGEPISNRNVFIYNNIVYNPAGFQSRWSHFAIYGPRTPNTGTNIPSPSRTDVNLQIKGNLIWNGTSELTLGIEGGEQGCADENPSCNRLKILSDNVINTVEPQLINPGAGDFRPLSGGNIFQHRGFVIPSFSGGDREITPLAPEGILANIVSVDRGNTFRADTIVSGAYVRSDSRLEDFPAVSDFVPHEPDPGVPTPPISPLPPPAPPIPPTIADPILSLVEVAPRVVRLGQTVRVRVRASNNRNVFRIWANIGGSRLQLRLSRGFYTGSWRSRGRPGQSYGVSIVVQDRARRLSVVDAGVVSLVRVSRRR